MFITTPSSGDFYFMKYLLEKEYIMNRSYSKIRHIQSSNLMLEQEFLNIKKSNSQMCINYESGPGLEKIKLIDKNIISLGINIKQELKNIKSIEGKYDDIKENINIYLDGVLGSMSADSIIELIKKIKEVKNNPQQHRSEDVKLNEEVNDPVLNTLRDILNILRKAGTKLPIWAWSLILVWVILRLLKCYIYKLESKLFDCAMDWKVSALATFTFIFLLDFKNIGSKNKLYGCK